MMLASAPFLVATVLLTGPAGGAPGVVAGAGAGTLADAASVAVVNPLPVAREAQTIALKIPDLMKAAPGLDLAKAVVEDAGGRTVESQLVDMDGDEKPDELVFQSDFGATETRTFVVRPGERRPPAHADFKVFGRFVRERHDDFAWENDRIVHRMYGPDLETWKKEPLVSSGIDAWSKRTRRLVINDWYMTDDYHRDTGEGADLYSVGKSRGCGGLGVWAQDKLHTSRNFVRSRVFANGPIRLVFELDYAPWMVGGRLVSETKRVTLDAGKNFDRFESLFKVDGPQGPLALGIGIAKHAGGTVAFDGKAGWMRSWEPLKKGNGNLGCAVVVAPGAIAVGKLTTTDTDHILVVNAAPNSPSVYHAGFAWDRGGDVADEAAWGKMVDGFTRELRAPVRVSLAPLRVPGATRSAATASAATASAATASAATASAGGDKPWSVRACDSVMARGPVVSEKWAYDAGLVLKGCLGVWTATQDRKYFDYVKRSVDHLIDADGNIKGYKVEEYNLDNINMGKVLFPLYADSTDARDKDRYKKALFVLRSQLKTHPRTSDGGFWHKLIYPTQMWLDGVYMASPFLAEFAVVFNEPAAMDDVARQVLLAEKHTRDPKSGLLYHGWDESKQQRWANGKTGVSSQFWGRAMGWYAMGVVDVLEVMPKNHPKRAALVAVLRRLAAAIASVQDKTSGVWWQVLNAPARGKNFEEASASAMFVYALARGARSGWLDAKKYDAVGARGFEGIVGKFVEADAAGQVNLKGVCKVAGLGGNPYRDGSFDYYTGTEIAVNDPKGVGAFILAGVARGQ